MLNDLLKVYRCYLEEKFSKETARTYYVQMKKLSNGLPVYSEIDKQALDKLIDNLSYIEKKNYYSKSKNALLHFCAFQGLKLSYEQMERIKELQTGTKQKHRKQKVINAKEVKNKIDHIRNKKMRLSYQVILHTGLRVSELSQITKETCLIQDDNINLSFIGKVEIKNLF